MESFVKNDHRLQTATEDSKDSRKKELKELKKDSEIRNLRRRLAIKEKSNDALCMENVKLRNSVASKINVIKGIENKYMEEIFSLQNKNRDLLKKLKDYEKKIHNLQDQVNSLELKLYFKQAELEENLQANRPPGMLHEKGQQEIINLKQENTALLLELGFILNSFYKAESTYQEKLNKQLKERNCELELKYEKSLNTLKILAQEKGIEFASGIIDYCKQEIDHLKTHSCRGDKHTYELEQKLFTKEHEIACYRMELLKYKCILHKRENQLKENNITYIDINRLTYNISQDQINSIQLPFVPANNNI